MERMGLRTTVEVLVKQPVDSTLAAGWEKSLVDNQVQF